VRQARTANWPSSSQLAREFVAVDIGQPDVEDGNVWLKRPGLFQRSGGIVGGSYRVAKTSEQLRQCFGRVNIVVNEQDATRLLAAIRLS
jgi:hypothetical protein